MTKYELLRWLDEPEVRRKILEIVAEPKPQEEIPKPVDEEKLSRLLQRVKDLEQQLQTAQFKNSQLEKSARSLQDKLKDWQETFARQHRRANNLQRELDDAQQKISDLDAQLQQRFARGWEIFQKYQTIGAHARQL